MHLWPIFIVFFLNAVSFGTWVARIPAVKIGLGLDLFTLSLCLMCASIGTLSGFPIAPRLTRRFGQRKATMIGGSLLFLMFIPPAFAPNAWALGLSLFFMGLTVPLIEVAMNAKAEAMERASRRRFMSAAHGFWSLGMMAGTALGGLFGEVGWSFGAQQLLLAPLGAAAMALVAARLPADADAPPQEKGATAALSLGLLLFCAVPLASILTEGAMFDWAAIFARENLGVSPGPAAWVVSTFAAAQAVGRFSGDWLAGRMGEERLIGLSCVLAALGLVAFAASPVLAVALPAAVLIGFGAANPYPLCVRLVAQLPGRSAEANVATLASIAFTAFLFGPPAIGFLGRVLGLPVALGLLAPLALSGIVLLPLARRVGAARNA